MCHLFQQRAESRGKRVFVEVFIAGVLVEVVAAAVVVVEAAVAVVKAVVGTGLDCLRLP